MSEHQVEDAPTERGERVATMFRPGFGSKPAVELRGSLGLLGR
jgi:hypothetical protein